MPFDQQNRIASVNTPFGKDQVGLLGLEGTETLGRLPSFELQLISEKKSLDPKQIVGQTVGVTLNLGNGKKRYFHGHAIQFAGSLFRLPGNGCTVALVSYPSDKQSNLSEQDCGRYCPEGLQRPWV
jgi:Phage tail baseplate hub (GPD)